jgi:hypothetical protein
MLPPMLMLSLRLMLPRRHHVLHFPNPSTTGPIQPRKRHAYAGTSHSGLAGLLFRPVKMGSGVKDEL